jgi:hypothetical protein
MKGSKKKQETVAVALNPEDAYNKVPYDVIINRHISVSVINSIFALLYERQVALLMRG